METWGGSRSSRSGDSERMSSSSRTVRLRRVERRAPGFRTIHCNDREANEIVRFKVLSKICHHTVGTTTRNLMEFFKCSIGWEVYGNGITEIERGVPERNGLKIDEMDKSADAIPEQGFNFDDSKLMQGSWRNQENPDLCKEFFRCLAICHTVLPEGDESPGKIIYQAESPDDAALVAASMNFGFVFYRRTPTMIFVRESYVEKMGSVQDASYEILNVLEFNSTRKRQSAVCRYTDGRLVLYCKGADAIKKKTRKHLEQFGSAAGLRTLCLAYKDLNADVYDNWNEKFIQAKSALRDREKKLDEIAELIETDLTLIGATATEDKLQKGVPSWHA